VSPTQARRPDQNDNQRGRPVVQKLTLLLLCLGVVLSSAGCAINRATATVSPDSEMANTKSFYVVRQVEDTRGIEKLISDSLLKRGYLAKSGDQLPKAPAGTDVVVTYNDRWMWDITMYMVELTVTFRSPENNFPMATGNSYHTSLTRQSPQEMVDEVLTNIFNMVKKVRETK
jgi:hypothetical protein